MQHTNLWQACSFLGSLPYLIRTVSIFVCRDDFEQVYVQRCYHNLDAPGSGCVARAPLSYLASSMSRWVRSICKCILLNSNFFVAGSIHEGHKRFSDISRGGQCSFMSFSALLRAQSLPDLFLTIYSKKTINLVPGAFPSKKWVGREKPWGRGWQTIPYLSQPVIIFSFSYLDVQSYSYCHS